MKSFKNSTVLLLFFFISFAFAQEEISDEYTAFFQKLEIHNSYNKVKLSGAFKTKDIKNNSYSFLWMNSYNENAQVEQKNSYNEKQSTDTWENHEIIIDINKDIKHIVFGAGVGGFGKFYFDDFRLEYLDNQGKWNEIEIPNASFEEKIIDNKMTGWQEGFGGAFRSTYYTFKNHSSSTHQGTLNLLIEGKLPELNLYPDIIVKSKKLNDNNEDVLITDINIIDVESGKTKLRDILIKDGKIHQIAKNIKSREEYVTIDGDNKWLLPGLVDSHIHLFQSGGLYTRPDAIDLTRFRDYNKERKWLKRYTGDILKRYLRCGITTVIDVGGPMYNFELRDQYSDASAYPNVFLTGPLISTYQPKAFQIENAPIIKAKTPDEAI